MFNRISNPMENVFMRKRGMFVRHTLILSSLLNRVDPFQIPCMRGVSAMFSCAASAGKDLFDQDEVVLNSRDILRSRFPRQLMKIVGVSFDGRQEMIARLELGQAVMFCREPENMYDPNAVAVYTLDNKCLGYVPKELTKTFRHSVCFGSINSVGKAEEGGKWGARVEVQPDLPPITVLPVVKSLHNKLHVENYLKRAAPQNWNIICSETTERTKGRCYLTGAPTNNVVAKWFVKETECVLQLAGFVLQAPLIGAVQYMLDNSERYEILSSYLQRMNGWNKCDVDLYLNHLKTIAFDDCTSTSRKWTFDLNLLQTKNIPVTEDLL